MSAPLKEDASRLELRARPRPVTRLNRRAIIALVGALAIVIALATMWAMRKPEPVEAAKPEAQRPVERVTQAEGLAALPRDYASVPVVPQLGPPGGELGRPLLHAEQEAGLELLPERASYQRSPEEDALRAQRLKEQNEALEAAKAQVFFPLKERGAHRSALASADDSSAQLVAHESPVADGNERSAAGALVPTPSTQQQRRSLIAGGLELRPYASTSLQTARPVYPLRAGTIIAAGLVTGINADLPGQVSARVTQNVYDTETGQYLLIPQGTILLGEYDSQVTYGQKRVQVVWARLIFPNGTSTTLEELHATDPAGFAGLEDRVDWHWRRIFAGAALSTLLGAGAELAAPDRSGREGTVIIATREGVQDTVNQVGQEITRRNLDIQPTRTIRAGFPAWAVLNRDLELAAYAR